MLALCAAVALLGLRRLPERRAAHPAPLRLSRLLAPLSYRDVPALLLGCLAFSSAFYGVYAFLADHVRRLLRCRPDRSVSSPSPTAPASCCRACWARG